MPDHEVPILIAGGSLAGMSAAMLLAHHGVPSLTGTMATILHAPAQTGQPT